MITPAAILVIGMIIGAIGILEIIKSVNYLVTNERLRTWLRVKRAA